MARRRRKRCLVCGELFWPDPRVRKRQRVCSRESCQAERRRRTQQQYRERHPEDGPARRVRAALAQAKAGGGGSVLRPDPPSVPWDELQDEIGPQGVVIAQLLLQLAMRSLRDQMSRQVADIKALFADYTEVSREDQMGSRAPPP